MEVAVEVTIINKAMMEAVAATSTITTTPTTEARMEVGTAVTADDKALVVTADTAEAAVLSQGGGFDGGGHHRGGGDFSVGNGSFTGDSGSGDNCSAGGCGG
ncbi:hypothetical protein NL676_001030 [Syzygium grande]|nr:hypothetical protein NL676_001030 [Syzygium grande]